MSSASLLETDRIQDPETGFTLATLSAMSIKDPKNQEKLVEEIMQMSQVRKGAGVKNHGMHLLQPNPA